MLVQQACPWRCEHGKRSYMPLAALLGLPACPARHVTALVMHTMGMSQLGLCMDIKLKFRHYEGWLLRGCAPLCRPVQASCVSCSDLCSRRHDLQPASLQPEGGRLEAHDCDYRVQLNRHKQTQNPSLPVVAESYPDNAHAGKPLVYSRVYSACCSCSSAFFRESAKAAES